MFSNVLLHIQPVKIHKRSVKFKTTMGLGLMTFYLFLILIVTGILLMFHYVPSTAIGPDGLPDAYSRMLNLRSNVFWGGFLRNMHRWAAHGMVAFVALHMLRVYLVRRTPRRREFNWVIGCILRSVDRVSLLHRLPASMGPTGLLGRQGGHRDRQDCSGRRTDPRHPAR